MSDIDFEDLELDPSKQSIEDIASMVNLMVAKEQEIQAMEAALAELNEEFRRLATEEVPTAMDAAGIKEFTLSDGRKLKVEDAVRANIPGDDVRKHNALKWFDDNGFEDLIKADIKYTFTKGDKELAETIINDILEIHGIQGTLGETIHNATLVSFCKEQIAKGDSSALDETIKQLIGLYQGRVAKFKKK